MTAKKRWVNSIYRDYQNPCKSTQPSISWSSSESEEEYSKHTHTRKKIRVTPKNNQIESKGNEKCLENYVTDFLNPTSNCEYPFLSKNFDVEPSPGECSPIFERLLNENNTEKCNESNMFISNCTCISPVINNYLKLEESSPVSNQNVKIGDNSPILGVVVKKRSYMEKCGTSSHVRELPIINNSKQQNTSPILNQEDKKVKDQNNCTVLDATSKKQYIENDNYKDHDNMPISISVFESPVLSNLKQDPVFNQNIDQCTHMKTNSNSHLNTVFGSVFKNQCFPRGLTLEKGKNNIVTQSYLCDSPVIEINSKLKNSSPLLKQDSDTKDNNSPILGKTSILRKIQSGYKKRNVEKELIEPFSTSPDLFTSQSTQIIEHDSPEVYNSSPPIDSNISQSTECINYIPSQCNSQMRSSNTNSTSDITNSSFLYHQPVCKKKKYKKGLASLLQKTLQLQKTRIAIWQHEVYTKKMDVTGIDKEQIIEFSLKKLVKEYGNLLLECEILTKTSTTEVILSSDNGSECTDDEENVFLIVIGLSTHLNNTCIIDHKYKLFPPYSIKSISYKSKNVPCYFNVTKLMSA